MSLLLLFAGGAKKAVGSSISGGTFARGRWVKMQEEVERKRLAEERRRLDAKRKKEKEREDALAALLAGWKQDRLTSTAAANELLARLVADHSAASLAGAQATHGILHSAQMQAIHAAHAKAQADAQEEEEAMAILLSL
jgi:hypothetical protein